MNFNQNSHIFIQETQFEEVVWNMAAILSRPQCVNLDYITVSLHRSEYKKSYGCVCRWPTKNGGAHNAIATYIYTDQLQKGDASES